MIEVFENLSPKGWDDFFMEGLRAYRSIRKEKTLELIEVIIQNIRKQGKGFTHTEGYHPEKKTSWVYTLEWKSGGLKENSLIVWPDGTGTYYGNSEESLAILDFNVLTDNHEDIITQIFGEEND